MKVKYANVLWRRRTWKQTMYIIHSDTFMWIHLQPLKRRRERTSRHTRKHRFTVTLYERTNTYFYPTKRKKNISVVFSDAVDCLPKTPFYEGTFRKTKDTSHISKKVFDEFRWSEARAVTSWGETLQFPSRWRKKSARDHTLPRFTAISEELSLINSKGWKTTKSLKERESNEK